MKKIVLFVLIFNYSFSQSNISGILTTLEGFPIANANITINELNTNSTIAFTNSNSKGEFNFKINSKSSIIEIKITHLSYETKTEKIFNENQKLEIFLYSKTLSLNEVIIQNTPIRKKNDTLNYVIKNFRDQKDKTISDVLKKMPGIEVLSDGKILYEGKAIQKYYIEGLDLLDGKYGIANDNLPVDSVTDIPILENHQPIKILDTKLFNDGTSINIKLKSKKTSVFSGKIGLGHQPFLRDINVNKMLFSKQQQLITSFQSNNIGDELSKLIKTLTLEEILSQFDNNIEKPQWLTVVKLNTPQFSEKIWLNNNSNLFTLNYLKRLKNDFEFKVNISFLNDLSKQNGVVLTRIFLPKNNINFEEIKENIYKTNKFELKLVLLKNSNKNYFKNEIQYKKDWNSENGFSDGNIKPVKQYLSNPFDLLNNKLKWILPINKELFTLHSSINYLKSNQSLILNDVFFNNILNNENPYDFLSQNINHSIFSNNNSLTFSKNIKDITIIPKIGLNILNHKLFSEIKIDKNVVKQDFQNKLLTKFTNFYLNLDIQYKFKSLTLDLKAPLNLKVFNSDDIIKNKFQKINNITFEPQINLINNINPFWKVKFRFNFENKVGNLENLYENYILNNYRQIKLNNSDLSNENNFILNSGLFYRNPIDSFFANIIYNYKKTNLNNILKTDYKSDGTTILESINLDNSSFNHSVYFLINKYFQSIKTTTSINLITNYNQSQQIINSNIENVENSDNSINLNINSKIYKWLSVECKNIFLTRKIYLKSVKINNFNNTELDCKVNFFPNDNQFIGLSTNINKSNKFFKTNILINVIYRYTLRKSKIDFEFNLLNLFNESQISIIEDSQNVNTISSFQLRERSFFISSTFRL